MSGKHFPAIVCLVTLGAAAGRARATEPVLDLRAPEPRVAVTTFTAMQVDDRPLWVQRLDSVARRGITFVCLRHGQQSNVVLGANPNGYLGVYTTPPGTRQTRQGC